MSNHNRRILKVNSLKLENIKTSMDDTPLPLHIVNILTNSAYDDSGNNSQSICNTAPYSSFMDSTMFPRSGGLRCANIPTFIRCLYEILSTEDTRAIKWLKDGEGFMIPNQHMLSKKILPKYFRHSKYASFQRQLNYFGFKKWPKDKAIICTYSRENFHREQPENLQFIKRKPKHPPQRAEQLETNNQTLECKFDNNNWDVYYPLPDIYLNVSQPNSMESTENNIPEINYLLCTSPSAYISENSNEINFSNMDLTIPDLMLQ